MSAHHLTTSSNQHLDAESDQSLDSDVDRRHHVPLFAPVPNIISPPTLSTPHFPPSAWLGRGLDLTTAMPGDIGSITQAIKTALRLIKTDKATNTQTFPSGATWDVPTNINASDDVTTSQSNYDTYRTGTEAFSAFQADVALSAKYMAVSGSASVGASISKLFKKFYSYAFFSYNSNLIKVSFTEYADYIEEAKLKRRLKNLGKFDPDHPDKEVVRKWRGFFRTVGTHVIVGCTYGARFQLNVWASNTEEETKKNFSVNVGAEYKGLTTGGKFDASISSTEQYKSFRQSVQKSCSCQGGDVNKAAAVAASPNAEDSYKQYLAWVQTAGVLPNVMTMQTSALWDMLTVAEDQELVDLAPSVEDVFQYITRHPAVHTTKCRFVINSDWGEFGLLTPSALIHEDPASPPDPKKDFLISKTKVSWGVEHSHKYERDVTVDFIIENDGSPVDIMLSHGSNGDQPGSGRCEVRFNENHYDNTGIKGNNWNSEWFYSCEVNQAESGKYHGLIE